MQIKGGQPGKQPEEQSREQLEEQSQRQPKQQLGEQPKQQPIYQSPRTHFEKVEIHVDGSGKSPYNKDEKGKWAMIMFEVLEDGEREFIKSHVEYAQKMVTNNMAEYNALILGVEVFMDGFVHGDGTTSKVEFLSDSQLVVNQVKGKYQCRVDHLKDKCNRVISLWNIIRDHMNLISNHKKPARLMWIRRKFNRADELLRD